MKRKTNYYHIVASQIDLRAWDTQLQRYRYHIHDLMTYCYDRTHRFCLELFSGLYDLNGCKVYQGDIVELNTEPHLRGAVYYDDDCGSFIIDTKQAVLLFKDYACGNHRVNVRVIGHVHEKS